MKIKAISLKDLTEKNVSIDEVVLDLSKYAPNYSRVQIIYRLYAKQLFCSEDYIYKLDDEINQEVKAKKKRVKLIEDEYYGTLEIRINAFVKKLKDPNFNISVSSGRCYLAVIEYYI